MCLFTWADKFLGIEKHDEKSEKDFNIVPCNIVTLQLKASGLWQGLFYTKLFC